MKKHGESIGFMLFGVVIILFIAFCAVNSYTQEVKERENRSVLSMGGYDLPQIPSILQLTSGSPDSWWDSNWTRRAPLTTHDDYPDNYQLAFTVTYDSDMNADFSDLRFMEDEDNGELAYWIENITPSTSADIWVRRIDNKDFTDNVIYMYYGNAAASTTSNIHTTMLLYDNFDGDNVDSTKWDAYGTPTVTEGYISITASETDNGVRSFDTFTKPFIIETRIYTVSATAGATAWSYGWGTTMSGSSYGLTEVRALSWWTEQWRLNVNTTGTGKTGSWTKGTWSDSWVRVMYDSAEFWYPLGFSGTLTNATVPSTSSQSVTLSEWVGTALFDWVRVRRYVSPEPTVSVGAEETAPPTNVAPETPENLLPSTRQTTTDVTISAMVWDNDGDDVNAFFFDNSDESLIDNVWVLGGSGTAQVDWTGLTRGNTYTFNVTAVDNNDAASDNSITQSFTVNSLPTAAVVSPENNAENENLNPTLDWSFSDTDGDSQTKYWVMVDDDLDFSSPIDDTGEVTSADTFYTIENELNWFTVYYWKVKVYDDYEWSEWQGVWNFKTANNIRVENIQTYDSGMNTADTFSVGDNVIIQFDVTDNLGASDIKAAYLTITDPNGENRVDHEGILTFQDMFDNGTWWDNDNHWTIVSSGGTPALPTGKYLQHGASGGSSAYQDVALVMESKQENLTEVTITCDVYIDFSNEDSERLIFRYLDSGYYIAGFISETYSAVGIEEYIDGTRYFTDTSALFSEDTWYRIKVTTNGSSASIYVNDVLKVTRAGLTVRSGRVGLGCDTGWIYFDNYFIGNPNGEKLEDIENGYRYKYTYTIPDNIELAGTWTITAEAVATNEAKDTKIFTLATDAPLLRNAAVYDDTLTPRTSFTDTENVVVRCDMLDLDNADLPQHQITMTNPQGTVKVDNVAMENVAVVAYGATYDYSYIIPEEADSNGTWSINLYAEDNDGNYTWDNDLTFTVDIKDPDIELLLTYTTENVEKAEYEFGETVRIKAEISDPDGRENISGVLVTIKNQSGEDEVVDAAMSDVGDIGNGNIYSYDYVLPNAIENRGVWVATVVSTDDIYTSSSEVYFVLDWGDNDFDYRMQITTSEMFSVNHTNEELGFVFTIDNSKLAVGDTARIVTDRGVELPFRVWKETQSGTTLTVYYNFLENIAADNIESIYIYYDNDTIPVSYPSYAVDMERTLVETVYELWYNENSGDNITYGKAIKVFDIDSDGSKEIVVAGRTHAGTEYNRGFIRIYDISFATPAVATLTLKDEITWLTDNHTFVYSLDIADVDADGTYEMITGGAAFDGEQNRAELNVWSYSSGFVNEDNATWYYDNTAIYGVYVDDVDADGTLEILVAGTCNNSENGMFRIYNFEGGTLNLEAAQEDIYISAGKLCELYGIATGDFYGDGGTKEIAVAGEAKDASSIINAFFKVLRWDNTTLSDDWTKNWYDGNLSELFSVAMGHADNDANIELVVGGNYFDGTRDIAMYKIWNATGGGYPNVLVEEGYLKWYISGHSSALTTLIGDIDLDNVPEITTVGFQNDGVLDRGDTKIRMWKGSVEENEYSEIWTDATSLRSGDFYDAAVVDDINGDGINELVYTGRYGMTPPTGTFVRVMGVGGITLALGSEEQKEIVNVAPEVLSISLDTTLIDVDGYDVGDNDVKITIVVGDNDNRDDIENVAISIRDNTDTVVVNAVLVTDNTAIDENTYELYYHFDPDNTMTSFGEYDVLVDVYDISGASASSGWLTDNQFTVDNLVLELTKNIVGDNLTITGRVTRASGLPVSLDNSRLIDNVFGVFYANDNVPVADNFENSFNPDENGEVYAIVNANGVLDGFSDAVAYEVVYLLIENKSLSGNQDNATLWVEVGYSDSEALENVSAELWVDNGTENMVISRVTVNVDVENKLTFSDFDPSDNIENLTFFLEDMLDNRSDKVVSFVYAEDNVLFTENTTIGVSIDGTAGEIFAGQTAVFTGTLISRSGWLTMIVDAELRSYGLGVDSETHNIVPAGSASWSLSVAPISSAWYTIEMYGSPTLLWSTLAHVEVFKPPTGIGTPPPSGFESVSKYMLLVVVLDEASEPVAGATVDAEIEAKLTDEVGTAVFKIPAGGYTVKVSKTGYENVIAGISDISQTSRLDVTLPAVQEEAPPPEEIPLWAVVSGIVVAAAVVLLWHHNKRS